jgi:hypothetical protein
MLQRQKSHTLEIEFLGHHNYFRRIFCFLSYFLLAPGPNHGSLHYSTLLN